MKVLTVMSLSDLGVVPPDADPMLLRLQVVTTKPELRLRFNAAVAVTEWTLGFTMQRPGRSEISGNIELFHWIQADEWEVCHLQLTSGLT